MYPIRSSVVVVVAVLEVVVERNRILEVVVVLAVEEVACKPVVVAVCIPVVVLVLVEVVEHNHQLEQNYHSSS